MISSEQKLEIEQFLISKKLPLDILLEVKDHMILQIEDCMNNENRSFEESFSKVELMWRENFSLTTYWMFYGREKLPQIAKNIMKQRFNSILFKSFLFGLLFFGLSFLMISLSVSLESFKIYFVISHLMFLLAAVLLYFFNLKFKNYFRKDYKYKGQINYTLYQQNLTLLMICFFGMSQLIMNGGEYLYNFFKSENNVSVITLMLLSSYRLFLYSFGIFGILNFIEHKKAIKKLQLLN
ncbi:hypothetical protein [Chryseobacterium binzhouense]|uniref:hypothetical protein n=1 Tax=Chryseobacterium binzhouense TaxID=2593646 RepID=UPI00289E48E0|nr:hypothetical protein [Chryseobacterium binzhouense]